MSILSDNGLGGTQHVISGMLPLVGVATRLQARGLRPGPHRTRQASRYWRCGNVTGQSFTARMRGGGGTFHSYGGWGDTPAACVSVGAISQCNQSVHGRAPLVTSAM